jgi:hypothetical protein
MRKYGIPFILLSFFSVVDLCAQEWSAQDSAWLRRVLSGQEKLQLNDATRKAIREGTLVMPDPAANQPLQLNPSEMPIIRSFADIEAARSQSKTPLMELPPAVLMLYDLDITDPMPDASRSTTFYENTIVMLKILRATTPIKATVNDPFTLRPTTTFVLK